MIFRIVGFSFGEITCACSHHAAGRARKFLTRPPAHLVAARSAAPSHAQRLQALRVGANIPTCATPFTGLTLQIETLESQSDGGQSRLSFRISAAPPVHAPRSRIAIPSRRVRRPAHWLCSSSSNSSSTRQHASPGRSGRSLVRPSRVAIRRGNSSKVNCRLSRNPETSRSGFIFGWSLRGFGARRGREQRGTDLACHQHQGTHR